MYKIVSIFSMIAMAPLYWSLVKEVKNKENIPKGNFILISNHSSHLDWFINGYFCTPRRMTFIGQADKMTTGFMKFMRNLFYSYTQVIPMDRESKESRRRAFDTAVQRLKKGSILIIYPEGTRTRDGKMHEFKTGAARLHLESGVPILPVAIKGTHDLMPPGGKMRIKKTVRLIVGKPIYFLQERAAAAKAGKGSGEYKQISSKITKILEQKMRELLEN